MFFLVNDYSYMYVWLLISCFVLYVWDYLRQSFLFGAISDIKNNNNELVHCEAHAIQLARLLYDSELVIVNHQNCLKHNKSFLSNEKKMG